MPAPLTIARHQALSQSPVPDSEAAVATPAATLDEAGALITRLEQGVATVVRGKTEAIRLATVCLIARGHLLVEDVPGVGKTTLAQALAKAVGLAFQRIQFTSDLLPSDILGISIFNQRDQAFEFVPGPIFAHVILADEINRATPKTQSALLEAMSEGKVSIERKRYALPDPFLVLATQNPLEYQGTFPLPESQLDRFLISLQIGYPAAAAERELLLSGGVDRELELLGAKIDRTGLLRLQAAARGVRVDGRIADYLLAIAAATRNGREFLLGASTRGLQGLCRAAQAHALCEGRAYVLPDDVKQLAPSVLAHRIQLRAGASGLDEARAAVSSLLERVAIPI